MPYNDQEYGNNINAEAGADLSAKQYFAVTLANATGQPVPGVKMVVSTAAKACAGILQDNPVSGQVGKIQTAGVTPAAISASTVLTAGTTMLEVDTGGTLKANASGIIVAQAMETLASNAAVCIVSVRLLPANAAIA